MQDIVGPLDENVVWNTIKLEQERARTRQMDERNTRLAVQRINKAIQVLQENGLGLERLNARIDGGGVGNSYGYRGETSGIWIRNGSVEYGRIKALSYDGNRVRIRTTKKQREEFGIRQVEF